MEFLEIIDGIKSGNKRALARAITIVENNQENYLELVSKIYLSSGKAHIIGITGSPGTGKSTLVDKVASKLQMDGKSIAIIAIDPSSPFSNGAILGDRIRMSNSQKTPDIFVRSIASRGQVGGLSKSVRNIITLMDVFGYDCILIETVGSGQSEIEIMNLAHTTIVVTAPGLGDEIQAQKAGIMEIANLFVVNKADLPSAEITANQIQQMLHTESVIKRKKVPVLLTSALEDKGIVNLIEKIEVRWDEINKTGERARIENAHAKYKLTESLNEKFLSYIENEILNGAEWNDIFKQVIDRKINPECAASKLFTRFLKKESDV
ncbi:methylmalonyl Co-A mutase-associated GTPase MeaB [Bacillus sp. F19]|nr:methylmalonyl Co-A mutase-associated GTPase MeaB [Bacillus sp. F19]